MNDEATDFGGCQVTDFGGLGEGNWTLRRSRILAEAAADFGREEVTSFVWARVGGGRNDAVMWVTVGSEEFPRSLEGEEVSDFVWRSVGKVRTSTGALSVVGDRSSWKRDEVGGRARIGFARTGRTGFAAAMR